MGMGMDTGTGIMQKAPLAQSKGPIVIVITANVKRVMCIVEDMGNMDMVRKKLTKAKYLGEAMQVTKKM